MSDLCSSPPFCFPISEKSPDWWIWKKEIGDTWSSHFFFYYSWVHSVCKDICSTLFLLLVNFIERDTHRQIHNTFWACRSSLRWLCWVGKLLKLFEVQYQEAHEITNISHVHNISFISNTVSILGSFNLLDLISQFVLN